MTTPTPAACAAACDASGLHERFRAVRAHSLALAAPLSPEDQCIQSMPDASPTKWHLAHTTWFFETVVLKPLARGYRVFDERYHYLFNSYYESLGPRHPRPQRGMLTRPAAEEVQRYRAHVDEALSTFIECADAASYAEAAPLITLGLHEEFTLYVAVALANTLPDAQEREAAWWSLARRVNGWGRIHLVERLAHTRRAGIKAWLLREGYRNSIMTEYLAHACATGGELLAALNDEQIDDALLQGAGDLIQALIDGGPAPGMDDYADGAAATERYMHHLALRRPDWLDAYLATDSIATFAGDTTRDWAALQALGWTPARRASIVEQARAIMQDERWRPLAQDGLSAGDGAEFQRAARAAQKLGLDAWSARLRRQEALGDANEWWHLMQTDDPQRIDQVITLAHRQIDLAQVATGPGTLMGLGPEFRQHSALDMILQDLGRFPGRGWTLVQAGLRSPVVRNRHMALRALDGWGRERWPAEARALLRAALNVEPDDRVRAGIENVLEGHRPA